MAADKKVAYLGMPFHSQPEMGAARGLFRANRAGEGPLVVKASYGPCGLLDLNCNQFWAWALTNQRKGNRVDYFALLHADVCPPDFWLETLVEELEAQRLDVLSAAVAIKDERGLTSTAIGHPGPQDYWHEHCRITMAELHRLPETFTSADLGCPDRPLLINTGCFVCKFDWRWAEKVAFRSESRIVWAGDQYWAETFPEDWNLARQMWQLGLRVGCTRKLSVGHVGRVPFANDGPWGAQEFDRGRLSEPFLRLRKPALA